MENPLLDLYKLSNDQFIPFDKIKSEHFEPAFEIAFAAAQENLNKIINNDEDPTFENTIEAIEYCGEQLDAIVKLFENLKETHKNNEIDRIAEIVMPKVTDWNNDLMLNEKLFERVKSVYTTRPSLNNEQQRLLEINYNNFVREGALLSLANKQILKTYNKQLEVLSRTFAKNLLEATNGYELVIEDELDLAGLPNRVRQIAKEEANARGKNNCWVFTLHHPSYSPFLQYADKENLRKNLLFALRSRAMQGKTNNQPIVLEIITLRDKKAKLLGYKTHADFVLQNRMAKSPDVVYSFFDNLYAIAHPKAEEDFEELRACKELLTGNKELQKWDVAYFSEKIRQSKYQFDEESFRPFFEIQNVIDSVFEHARLLYGLVFKKRIDIPVYHEDVTVYEVTDANKKYVGILYFDLFPRASKAGGAWIDTFRNQHKKDEKNIRSNALIVGNLTKPTKDSPSLLSFWDVETIFHEFGHGLHILLSESRYVSPGALQSRWDFIELPSQFMQTFLTQKRSLEIVGKHYQTGEVITPELIEKKIAADKFLAAWIMIGQIGDATLDMKWHDGSAEGVIDIQSFEKEIKKPFSFFPDMPNTNQSTTFSHIFDGGYSAAYYSYHWAEVLSADAFEYFKENGLFSKEIAEKFRENILSKGNSEEPMELYKRFRGREPDPHALLRMKGLE